MNRQSGGKRRKRGRLRRISSRLVNRAGKEPGAAPGTLIHTGDRKSDKVSTRYIEFDPVSLAEGEFDSMAELRQRLDSPKTTWIDLVGLHDVAYLEEFGDALGLDSLILEDVLNTSQRPKIEEHPGLIFIVLKMLRFDEESRTIDIESVSLFIRDASVVSVQERPADVFEAIRERLRRGNGRIRSRGADYVAYAIIDAVVDEYFRVADRLGDEAEELEERLLAESDVETLRRIHSLRREVLVLRRAVWPLRDVLAMLCKRETPLIDEGTLVYFRDVQDHLLQVTELTETLRDLVNGVMDLYLSTLGNRTNETMKVLTMIATVFIPLSFLAGLYGMNFRFMPELEWRWGYPAVLLLMLAIVLGLVWFFRRRRWI